MSTLGPGQDATWKGVAGARIVRVDLREEAVDIGGEDIMTADKVTLRVKAVVTYRVADPAAALTEVEDARQALYGEAQLALRAMIRRRELGALLSEKDAAASELDGIVRQGTDVFLQSRGPSARHP